MGWGYMRLCCHLVCSRSLIGSGTRLSRWSVHSLPKYMSPIVVKYILTERPLDNVNLNINVLMFTPDERPPLLKGHFSGAKGVASQEGFHCKSMRET